MATGNDLDLATAGVDERLHLHGIGEFVLRRRDEEHVDTVLVHRRHLLGETADRTDRAVEVDRAGHRDVAAAGQLSGRELVDQRQRERQAGRRPADVVGLDVDLERQVHDAGVERTEPDDGTARLVGRLRQDHRDGLLADARTIDEQLDRITGRLAGERVDQVVDRAEHLTVGLQDRVGRIDLLVGREVLGARPVVGRFEADHLLHDDFARGDLGLDAERGQRDVLRLLLRGAHRLQPDLASLIGRPRAELVLGRDEPHGGVVATGEPRQHRLRRAR